MNPSEADPREQRPESAAGPADRPSEVGPGGGPPTARLWAAAVVAALVAGGLAWGVGERLYQYYKPSEEAAGQSYDFRQLTAELRVVNARNAAIAFGALGGLLGLALGTAGGLARPSAGASAGAGGVGLVLGALAGALPALAVMPFQFDYMQDNGDLELSPWFMPLAAAVHASMWGPIGAAAGLAFAWGARGPKGKTLLRGLLGGLIGALIGTIVYEGIGAVLFPMDRTTDPISISAASRGLARLCVATFTAIGVVVTLSSSSRPTRDRRS